MKLQLEVRNRLLYSKQYARHYVAFSGLTALLITLSAALIIAPSYAESPDAPTLSTLSAAYPLDALSRETSPRGRVKCPKLTLVKYRGEHIQYHKPTKVHPAFRERLKRFELLVREVALEVYGRAPDQIKHLGTYNCRRIGGYPHLLSEHSFGNGIDIASFRFPRLKRGAPLRERVPKVLRRAFTVDILKYWSDRRTAQGLHQRFLHTLGRRLIASEIFRVLLGPSFPGHTNHFHLDYAPYKLVSIFD